MHHILVNSLLHFSGLAFGFNIFIPKLNTSNMATAAEAATAELFQANLLGVPEVASEDEIRWCFRKWDLMKIDFDQPLKVVVSFESAGDLSAVLASTGNFIIRGQSISIEGI